MSRRNLNFLILHHFLIPILPHPPSGLRSPLSHISPSTPHTCLFPYHGVTDMYQVICNHLYLCDRHLQFSICSVTSAFLYRFVIISSLTGLCIFLPPSFYRSTDRTLHNPFCRGGCTLNLPTRNENMPTKIEIYHQRPKYTKIL